MGKNRSLKVYKVSKLYWYGSCKIVHGKINGSDVVSQAWWNGSRNLVLADVDEQKVWIMLGYSVRGSVS